MCTRPALPLRIARGLIKLQVSDATVYEPIRLSVRRFSSRQEASSVSDDPRLTLRCVNARRDGQACGGTSMAVCAKEECRSGHVLNSAIRCDDKRRNAAVMAQRRSITANSCMIVASLWQYLHGLGAYSVPSISRDRSRSEPCPSDAESPVRLPATVAGSNNRRRSTFVPVSWRAQTFINVVELYSTPGGGPDAGHTGWVLNNDFPSAAPFRPG